MFESVLLMGGLGLIIGGALALASKVFYVYVDPKVAAIDDVLPGANCGGCGYPGCSSNAEAIVKGLSSPDSCVAAGDDVTAAIAAIMGVSIGEKEPEIAIPGCYYGTKDADVKYLYDGIGDCRAAALVFGGMKDCNIGCLGLGTCVAACPFGALKIGESGLPEVDEEKCTACGTCEKVCPKHIIKVSSVTRRIMREYTEDHCVTPCQRACPTGIDIRAYLGKIQKGDNTGAVQVIKERNPFPTVIGRICPAPCESECRRQLVDESVAINSLKRFVCDIEMETGERTLPYKAPATDRRVAVIGGGVEGLSTAFFTARLGHAPTIFESTSILGGLLRIAIADERLPQDVLDWDIDGILEMGVKVKTGKKLGRDFTIASLLSSGYEAVFTSTGGWDSRISRGEISEVASIFPGAYLMIDLLRSDVQQKRRIPCGKNVVIAGGGAIVPDAVKICMEYGADKVTVISRDTKENSSCDEETIKKINQNGADLIYSKGITKICGEDEQLTHIELTDLENGEKSLMDVDTLFLSAGRFPELVFIRTGLPEEEEEAETETLETVEEQNDSLEEVNESLPVQWEGVEIYKPPADRKELGFLSCEDELSGYGAAVKAINGGRRAAATIHQTMNGVSITDWAKPITKQSVLQGVTHVEGVQIMPRTIMPLNDPKSGKTELYKGYSPDMALNEANRCLQCGLLCYQRTEAEESENKELSEKAEV